MDFAKQVADIWGEHVLWAKQRSKVWNDALSAFEPATVNAVISDMMNNGENRPTLPAIVTRCNDFEAVDAKPKKDPVTNRPIVYGCKRDGVPATAEALEHWRALLAALSVEGLGLDVDLWLAPLGVEVKNQTFWLDLTEQGVTSRRLTGFILTTGRAMLEDIALPEPLTLTSPLTLELLQKRLNGISIGLKGRASRGANGANVEVNAGINEPDL